MGAVPPRLSWLGHVAGFGALVPRHSLRRVLLVRFSAYHGWGLLLALVGGWSNLITSTLSVDVPWKLTSEYASEAG